MIDTLFYTIWRDIYLRKYVRNQIFRNKTKVATLEYLYFNHQYLALLSDDDKRTFNINVYLYINVSEIDEYIEYKNKYNINIIDILHCEDWISFDHLPIQGLRKLIFVIDDSFRDSGCKLPDSIEELVLAYSEDSEYNDQFDRILDSLPRNLKILSLPTDFKFTKQCVLPETLQDLDYNSNRDSLCHLVVPQDDVARNRVFEKCIMEAESIRDLEWLKDKTWIRKCHIVGEQSITVPKNVISSHIRELLVYNRNVVFEQEAIPASLEFVYFCTEMMVTQGMLPNGLKIFYHQSFKQPLEPGLIPDSIETLLLNYYNHPLSPNALPKHLKVFEAPLFNQELSHQSLPTSLNVLSLRAFTGSFSSVGPLDHLRTVKIQILNQSISTLLSNVKDIYLQFESIGSGVTLLNTVIEKLKINSTSRSPLSLPINFFPASLKHLDISNIQIKSHGIINDGCVSVISNQEINHSFIPSSVTNITINKKN